MARVKPDRRRQLREWYGLEFPESFFGVWELACELNRLEPAEAFGAIGLRLGGAYDVLAGQFDTSPPAPAPCDGASGRLWTHDFSYRDAPEFQVIFWGRMDGLHFGLWFDDPAKPPTCVESYYNRDAYELNEYPANLFLALRLRLEEALANDEEYLEEEEAGRPLELLREAIRPRMPGQSKRRKQVGEDYQMRYMDADEEPEGAVAVTWGDECIRAPEGTYREPPEDDETIWREVRTRKGAARWLKEADEALRAGYPATALKLGKDVRHLAKKADEPAACAVMEAAYLALGRPLLAEILRARTARRDEWDAARGQ